jgi:mono/diheme cytochrome c family protein
MNARRRAAVIASAPFVVAVVVSLSRAAEPERSESVELAAPPGTSEELLASLLDDDLNAGAAGGVPTALVEALVERDPLGLGRTPDEFYARYGALRARGRARPVGITEREVLGARILNYNCFDCHCGEEDGKLVVGAPNRTLDLTDFLRTVITTTRAVVRESDSSAEGIRDLVSAARAYHRARGERLSPADALAVAVWAEGFARLPERENEPPYGPGRTVVTAPYRVLRFHMSPGPYAPVKPPDLFGVRARTNLLWTGNEHYDPDVLPEEKIARNGLLVPWVQLDPLTREPAPDDRIVRRLSRYRRMAFLLARATPPPAPAPPDDRRALHERGRAVFEETCSRCHGRYSQTEEHGRLATRVFSYEERLVPVARVGTDPSYEASNDDEFVRRIDATPIGKLYKRVAPEHTYVARPLLGLRLRFPYLHNASVPSLRALLTPPPERPARFWVGRDAPLDPDACGYSGEAPSGPRARLRDTTLPGNRAIGHPFGTTLAPEEKRALIEYLKTL